VLDLDALFETFERTAFRLETHGGDAGPGAAGSFASFLSGRPFDLAWHQPWLEATRRVVDSGRTIQRVRVTDDPPTPRQYFELVLTPFHVAAGEDVLVAPAQLGLPALDFWLFDDEWAVTLDFDPAGALVGSEVTAEPAAIAELRRVRDRACRAAVPYADYVADHPLPR